mgnify:FL=1
MVAPASIVTLVGATGTSTAYVVSISGFVVTDGATFDLQPHVTCGASPTININGAGAVYLTYVTDTGVLTQIPAGWLYQYKSYRVTYDSTSAFYVVRDLIQVPGTFTGAVSGTTISGSSAGMPKFRAYRGTSNQAITTSTYTKVQFNAESFDTNSNFDSVTNYRFTPTVAGYYVIGWGVFMVGDPNTLTVAASYLYKNGANAATGSSYRDDDVFDYFASAGSTILYMNGSTDYLEVFCYITGTALPVVTSDAAGTNTHFSGALLA